MKYFILNNKLLNLSSLIMSLIITWKMIRTNIQAPPLCRSSHSAPKPTAGGVACVLTFIFFLLTNFVIHTPDNVFLNQNIYLCLAISILGIVGFIDDFKGLSYRFRLLIHVLCAGLLVSSFHVIQWPLLGEELSYIQKIFTVFVIVSLINATNFIDGLDGLLAGSVLICLLFSSFIISPHSQIKLLPYGLLFFSLLGFFVFNFPQSKIFMGDTGSTFIGFILAYLALYSQNIYGGNSSNALIHKGFIYTLTPMTFLWFDVGFTLIRRFFMKNARITEAHRDHMIHILNDAGYSHVFISVLYFLTVFIMGIITLLLHQEFISFFKGLIIYIVLQTIFCFWVFSQKKRHIQENKT